MDQSKACRVCGRTLPLSEFYRDARTADGYRGECKSCRLAYEKAKGPSHICSRCRKPRGPQDRAHKRYCADCWRQYVKVYMRGYRSRPETATKRDALQKHYREQPAHRQLARERAQAWRIANPQRRSEQQRRRNALKKSGVATHIPFGQLEAKLAYWGWRCWINGPTCIIEPENWDHVKPLTKGGAHILANLRPACADCNRRKRDRWPFPTHRRI